MELSRHYTREQKTATDPLMSEMIIIIIILSMLANKHNAFGVYWESDQWLNNNICVRYFTDFI